MPTLDLRIDSYGFRLQTADLEMAGKWLADLLVMHKPNSTSFIQLQVSPFYIPDPKNPRGQWIPDWDMLGSSYTISVPAESASSAIVRFTEQLLFQADQLKEAGL